MENGGISADGLHWRVKLRPDVKWHDGTPFTAEDVKYNIDLINNPKFLAGRRAGHELVRDITVVSPTEMTWRMEQALRALSRPSCPGPSSCPKHILEKEADPNKAAFANEPVGTGPFTLGRARAGRPHHAARPTRTITAAGPISSALVFKYIPDLTVLYTQFQTGDIDYIGLQGITPDHYDEAKTLADRIVIAGAAGLHREHRLQSRQAAYSRTRRCARRSTRDGQEEHHRADLLRPADADRILPAHAVLGLQSRPAEAELRSGQGQGDARRRRLEARRRTASARRTACGSNSPTPPRPATTCANRRSNCCSRTGRRSAPR